MGGDRTCVCVMDPINLGEAEDRRKQWKGMLVLGKQWVWARGLSPLHSGTLVPSDFFIMVMAMLDFILMQLNSHSFMYHLQPKLLLNLQDLQGPAGAEVHLGPADAQVIWATAAHPGVGCPKEDRAQAWAPKECAVTFSRDGREGDCRLQLASDKLPAIH